MGKMSPNSLTLKISNKKHRNHTLYLETNKTGLLLHGIFSGGISIFPIFFHSAAVSQKKRLKPTVLSHSTKRSSQVRERNLQGFRDQPQKIRLNKRWFLKHHVVTFFLFVFFSEVADLSPFFIFGNHAKHRWLGGI